MNAWVDIWLVSASISGLIGMKIGEKVANGGNPTDALLSGWGMWLGLIAGPLGWIVVLLLPRDGRSQEEYLKQGGKQAELWLAVIMGLILTLGGLAVMYFFGWPALIRLI